MSFFKRADKGLTDTYYFGEEGDDQDWIRVRASLSKSEANEILFNAPTGERDIRGGLNFLDEFFKAVIVDWSFADEEGNPIPATLEEFQSMESAGARAIETKLSEHLNKLLGREIEKAEGESLS